MDILYIVGIQGGWSMDSPNEVRVVTRQETFNDFAVRELAQTRARCMCFIQNGRCKKETCAHCAVNREYNRVAGAMSVYDNVRLSNYISEYYARFSHAPEAFMDHKTYVRSFMKIYLIALFIMALIFIPAILMLEPFDTMEFDPYSEYTEAMEPSDLSDNMKWLVEQTLDLLAKDPLYGKDITCDGNFNCQDRAILFKLLWGFLCDSAYKVSFASPDVDRRFWLAARDKCILVRNYNKETGMNHLFPMILDHDVNKIMPIEPDIDWKGRQHIRKVFKRKYDPDKNHYNETAKFMSRIPVHIADDFRNSH